MSHSVDEANAFKEFTESLGGGDPLPTLLRFEAELQHHRQCGVFGESTFHPPGLRGASPLNSCRPPLMFPDR